MTKQNTNKVLSAPKETDSAPRRWLRILLASTAALSLVVPDIARAACSDGSTMPAGGFVVGRDPQVSTAANWSQNVFTGTAGSIFVPDASTTEHNNVGAPSTGGGHNWVFDQGSTLCKETDTGIDPGTGRSASWAIPPNTSTDCMLLPVIKNGKVVNLGDIPYQGQTVTPLCDTSKLSTIGKNPLNTYANQLGCSISALKNNGALADMKDPRLATTYLFVAGIKGGLFSIPLDNVNQVLPGGTAGKTVGPQQYYSDIPEGSKLTNAAVSPDGMFAMATSIRRAQFVIACLNPLGDPGDPTKPITLKTLTNFANTAVTTQVKCSQVGSNNLSVDLTTVFGPDNQPYFGGQRIVNSFNGQPGGTTPSAWPQCTFLGVLGLAGTTMNKMKTVFRTHTANNCGTAQPNFGFSSALVTQPNAIVTHVAANGDMYMYTGPLGGTIVQFKLTINSFTKMTSYQFRTYLTGVSLTTGLGVADDVSYASPGANGAGSLMIFTDPTAVGLAGQEVVTRLPLCEDM
jgi:hypothetical protein